MSLDIVVPIRLMPNLGDELEVDAGGTDIDRDLVEMVINEFDDQALEEAVLIKEASGATVTAVGLRGDGIEQALRTAFARGADRAVVADAGELHPHDTVTAAAALADAIGRLAPDLVLTGVQTPYDVFGQTAPVLGALLGWPQASVVVAVTAGDRSVRVTQEYAGGRLAVLELQLPAVVGVQSASKPPRYVSMARLRQAMSDAALETLPVAASQAGGGARIVAIAPPPHTVGATMLDGDPAQAAKKIAALLSEKGALVS